MTTVRMPGLAKPVTDGVDGPLSREALSARYPRSRECGGLILAVYMLEIDTHASEQYIQRINSAVEGVKLREDPRMFDDELDPVVLPDGYCVGEGYLVWQARINTADNIHYKTAELDL